MRPAKAGWNAERLRLSDDDIGPSLLRLVLTSRLEYAERDCLADIRDRHCIMLVRHLRDVVGSLDCSKEIGRLHDYGGRVRIQFASELFQVQSSVRRVPDKLDLDAEIFSVSIDDSSILGMHAPSHEELVFSSDTLGHQYGFGQASTAVIERRIRNFHSRQLRDISLKLEDRLQGALRDFGLIRRVGGIELRSRYQRVDDDRNVMAINAGSNKRCRLDFIFGRPFPEVFQQFRLAEGFREVQKPAKPQFFRNTCEKLFRRIDANLRQHLLAVGLRVRDVSHLWGGTIFLRWCTRRIPQRT